MRWRGGLVGLALFAAGCPPAAQQRVRLFNADGVYLYQAGEFPGARDCFQAAAELAPEDPSLRYNLGRCQERLGQVSEAEKTYRYCLRLSPDHPDCRHALAELL